ncbi:hypothetical protein BC830DRAFT_812891 [Chytriomyces sp. MP71]|nr:hypothetical protein BC830DRAFT_812891 [Chytriomyces sp. MP71]
MLRQIVHQYEERIDQAKRLQTVTKRMVSVIIPKSAKLSAAITTPTSAQPLKARSVPVSSVAAPAPSPEIHRKLSTVQPERSQQGRMEVSNMPNMGIPVDPVFFVQSGRGSTDSGIDLSDEAHFIPSREPSLTHQTLSRESSITIPPRRQSIILGPAQDNTAKGVEMMRAKGLKRTTSVAKKRATLAEVPKEDLDADIAADFAASILAATDSIFQENKVRVKRATTLDAGGMFKRVSTYKPIILEPTIAEVEEDSLGPIYAEALTEEPFAEVEELTSALSPTSAQPRDNLLEAVAELNQFRIEQMEIQVQLRDRMKAMRVSIEALTAKRAHMTQMMAVPV